MSGYLTEFVLIRILIFIKINSKYQFLIFFTFKFGAIFIIPVKQFSYEQFSYQNLYGHIRTYVVYLNLLNFRLIIENFQKFKNLLNSVRFLQVKMFF